MEAIGIGVEHDKCLLHPEHSTKLSDKGDRVIASTNLVFILNLLLKLCN
jgi:hypothetical protein